MIICIATWIDWAFMWIFLQHTCQRVHFLLKRSQFFFSLYFNTRKYSKLLSQKLYRLDKCQSFNVSIKTYARLNWQSLSDHLSLLIHSLFCNFHYIITAMKKARTAPTWRKEIGMSICRIRIFCEWSSEKCECWFAIWMQICKKIETILQIPFLTSIDFILQRPSYNNQYWYCKPTECLLIDTLQPGTST